MAKNAWRFAGLVWLAIGALSAKGQPLATGAPSNIPPPPDCLDEASAYHQVNPWVLRAIIWHESRNNASVVVRNTNGSVDIGYGGINSVHYRELGIYNVQPNHLLDSCVNTYVAAWLLAKKVKLHGDTWEAIGSYNSENEPYKTRYANLIRGVLSRWKVIE